MRTVKRTNSKHHAWAIETGEADHPRYRAASERLLLPHWFRNRRVARNALERFKAMGEASAKARVVRVSVTVTTIGRG